MTSASQTSETSSSCVKVLELNTRLTYTCITLFPGPFFRKGIVVPRSFCFRAITAPTKKKRHLQSACNCSAVFPVGTQTNKAKRHKKEKEKKDLNPATPPQWFIAVGSKETVPSSGALKNCRLALAQTNKSD